MDVIEVDVADDAALRTLYAAWAAGQAAHRGAPADPYEFLAAMVRHHDPAVGTAYWTVFDGDRPVGAIEGRWWDGQDNRHRFEVKAEFVPDVQPPVSVLGPVAARAAQLGRTLLGVEVASGTPGARLARDAGGVLGLTERRGVLRLADVDKAVVEEWAMSVPAGYSLVRWDDRCPDELLPAYCRINEAMNTAPRGDLDIEDFVMPPERMRGYERMSVARGFRQWLAVARHDATGELAGSTELRLSRWRPELAEQGNTVVVPDHRGHGIGRWLKAVNLVRVLDEAPEVDAIETWNAESNAHMLAINEALGSRPAELGEDYEAPVAAVLAAAAAG